MAIQLTSYSAFTTKVCALIGIPYSGMNADETGFLATFFDSKMAKMWDDNNWLAICPYGEARFAGNLLTYPNDLTKSAYWTNTALTITANSLANPADGRVTASKLLETSANNSHDVSQSYTFIPNINYQYSAYIRAAGRQYVELDVYDGATSYSCFFDVVNGTVGTDSGNLNQTSTITQQNNGFWLCTIYFTTNIAAGAGSVVMLLSDDGTNIQYTGNPSLGVYSWGQLLQQTSYADQSAFTIPFDQTGESAIDVVYQVWNTNPNGNLAPRPQAYAFGPNGIQIIGPSGYWGYGINYSAYPNGYTPNQNPFYLYYRKRMPSYTGSAYDSTATYAVDDQILFTNSSSVSNYYKCTVATTAGQSPMTTPNSWELIEIPMMFLSFAVYGSYADWLRMDGQLEKAAAMDAMADTYQEQESDKQERQAGWIMPIKVQTHVTSQARTW